MRLAQRSRETMMPTAATKHHQTTHRINALTGVPITESRPLTKAEQGYGAAWQRLRRAFVSANPFCVHCLADGVYKAVEEVDHRIPHMGRIEALLDWDNLQSLCRHHHATKTRQENPQ